MSLAICLAAVDGWPDLRSMTSGQGSFTMEFDHYEEAPQPVMDRVIAEAEAAAEGK